MRLSQRVFQGWLCILPLTAASVFAQITQTITTSLPPVGLAPTETAQVNVVNSAALSPTGVVANCTGSIAFYDGNGNLIGSATDFKLGNGQISSFKLAYASASTGTSRIVVRGVISLNFESNVAFSGTNAAVALPPPCLLNSSLETYDTATGVTHLFYGGAPPQITPAFRSGEIARTLPATLR